MARDRSAIPAAWLPLRRLRYVHDGLPGIRRRRCGQGYCYTLERGRRRVSRDELRRIRALAIPPAWRGVWICLYPDGHLQATGRDARKRKQYRYHPLYRELQDSAKFTRIKEFARALPAIRRRTAADLSRPGLGRRKILALIVRLLETTLVRVGNAEYARANESFGLTTMRDRHMRVVGADRVKFMFKGKSGVLHEVYIDDPKLGRLIRRCQELPGQELFQYVDERSVVRDVDSNDVNMYLRALSGAAFTAKDFRTWQGTMLAALLLERMEGVGSSLRRRRRDVLQVVKEVAAELRNTAATCRKYYIHPGILQAYEQGRLRRLLREGRARRHALRGLRSDERAVLHVLDHIETAPI